MKELTRGEYYGNHKHELILKHLILTDTEYTHEKVDWHYHENPYFTYLLQGKLFEANKKESYYLEPGSLLFHNWQDAHHNIKPSEYTRGFHIELSNEWYHNYNISSFDFEGSSNLKNPLIKQHLNKIILETKISDDFTEISIELLILNIFDKMKNDSNQYAKKKPKWIDKINAIMHEEIEICSSLSNLATYLNIHPVHLSREFPNYFKTSFGDYLRTLKVNKAIPLIINGKDSMTEIAYMCDFCDQSHFTNSFKRIYGITPLGFSKHIKC